MKDDLEAIRDEIDTMVLRMIDEGRHDTWFMTEAAIKAQNAIHTALEADELLTAAIARAIESLQPLRENLDQTDQGFSSCHNARVGLEDIVGGHLGFPTVEALLGLEHRRLLATAAQ
jgi:hypothetical protein